MTRRAIALAIAALSLSSCWVRVRYDPDTRFQVMTGSDRFTFHDRFRYPDSQRYVVPFPAARFCERWYGTTDNYDVVERWYARHFHGIRRYSFHIHQGGGQMLLVGTPAHGTGIDLFRHIDKTFVVVAPAWQLIGLAGNPRTCEAGRTRAPSRAFVREKEPHHLATRIGTVHVGKRSRWVASRPRVPGAVDVP